MPTMTLSTSTTRPLAIATAVATIIALAANTIISFAAQAAGADPVVSQGLMPYAYGTFTVLGVLGGAVGWTVIRSRAARPSATLRWLVPTVVAVSLIPNVPLGMADGWLGASALGLMHVAIAAVTVPVLRRFLPLPR